MVIGTTYFWGINMIVERGRGREVIIRYRDDDRKRQTLKVKGFYPYGFVHDDEAHLFDAIKKESGHRGVYGEPLTKMVMPDPADVSKLKNKAKQTWECNIPYTNRVLTDRLLAGEEPIPNYDHRVWSLDCEWNPQTNRLRVICVHDSYTDREFLWFNHREYPAGKYPTMPCKEHPEGKSAVEFDTPALAFDDEASMLKHFMRHMATQDPDIITGWFVVGADIKVIAERLHANKLSPNGMSPMRRFRHEYRDWAQPIVGRTCIDLMLAFSKLWELKNGKLPGYGLADAALECLGENKVQLENGHDTYYSDIGTYLDYCRQDVRLLPKLDAAVNALGYYTAIQHIVQCDIQATPFVTKLFSCLALRDPMFTDRIPTRPQFDMEPYQGAEVMKVSPGIYDSVASFDIKQMYHSNAAKHNISWDTLDPDGEDCGNGVCFRKGGNEDGLLVRQMSYITQLRDDFKGRIKEATTEQERVRWDTMQYACKSLVASMYGVAGDSKHGLYHPKVAAAITYTSRRTLSKLKELCINDGYEVLYGHTDSVFVRVPEAEEGIALNARLNEQMAPIVVEYERWTERMVLMAKNRYAGRVTWTDGEAHAPRTYVKGIEMKQSRMPTIMKSAMQQTINALLEGGDETTNTEYIESMVGGIIAGDYSPAPLCMKGKLERNLSDYKVLSGNSAAADWANRHLGKGYRKGSFFLVTINDEGKYIAFDDPDEIEGITKIGFRHLAERFVVNKVEPYYAVAGWSLQPIVNALNGLSGVLWV